MSDEKGIDACGPGWTSRYLWQGPDDAWLPVCQEHDRRYTYRSGTRAGADRVFLDGMLAASESRTHRAVAYVYFAAVRLFGWALWHSGMNRDG